MSGHKFSALLLTTCLLLPAYAVRAQDYVCVETNLGEFCMSLYHEQSPNTVRNFLNYVNDGDYDGTLMHRSVANFVVQGGGYAYDPVFDLVPTDPPIANEFSMSTPSNTRGTVAMAKRDGDPDSATSQWFINVANNGPNLDFANGGFVVFAGISYGMDVVNAIADLRLVNLSTSLGGAFGSVPVLQDEAGVPIEFPDDFVQVRRMYATDVLPPVARFAGGSLSFPVAVGARMYRVTLNLTAQDPAYVFTADRSTLAAIEDSGQDAAQLDAATGLLTIPSLEVGNRRFSNVTFQLTDSKNLAFTLTGYE